MLAVLMQIRLNIVGRTARVSGAARMFMKRPFPTCLRCGEVELTQLQAPSKEIEFYECPKCYQPYARQSGKALTFRWLHPVSLPLYVVLFVSQPIERASQIAEQFVSQRSAGDKTRIVDEIELELLYPTQNVRDILDNPQTEDDCRTFLAAFVECVRTELGNARE